MARIGPGTDSLRDLLRYEIQSLFRCLLDFWLREHDYRALDKSKDH